MSLGAWSLDPALGWCVLAGVGYGLGRHRIASRRPHSELISSRRVWLFTAGVAVLTIAIASPLDHDSDELFSLHMIQHLLITLVAPALIVAARPLPVLWRALPHPLDVEAAHRRRKWALRTRRFRRSTTVALAIVAIHVSVFVGWHVPAAYDAAIRSGVVHGLEHLSMFVSGLLLWWVVLSSRPRRASGVGVVYLFLAGLPMGALAALLTLSPRPLYQAHLTTSALWGLTPLSDQQLAGAIMWVPGGIIYLVAASALFVSWLGAGPAPGQHQGLTWEA